MTSPLLEWRPIDTAPKEAERVVLITDGDQVEPAEWVPWGVQANEGPRAREGFWNFLRTEAHFEPTYWMSLPPAPYENKPGEAG